MKPSKITADDIIFLGLKSKVAALSKRDGRILWSTQLPGGMGGGFVTVNSDGKCVYAYTNGKIHCLDISSGRILWTNELAGFGYGIASICIPGFPTAPDAAAYAKIEADRRSRDNAAAAS
jgi:outer membrane protein assembly factor BamB